MLVLAMLYRKPEEKGEGNLFTLFHSVEDLFFARLLGARFFAGFLRWFRGRFLWLGFRFLCHIRSPMRERHIGLAQTEFESNA